MKLLSREQFDLLARVRDKHRCVFCDAPSSEVHHIFDRKLYADGGYYLNNAASVCSVHHWDCETTLFTIEDVRIATKIETLVYPPTLSGLYDKWGNRCWPSGLRSWGPLELDTGARKALIRGGFMHVMMPSDYKENV